jgi:hypothetical protein
MIKRIKEIIIDIWDFLTFNSRIEYMLFQLLAWICIISLIVGVLISIFL